MKKEETKPFYGAGFSAWRKNALCIGFSTALLLAAIPVMASSPAQHYEAETSMAVEQSNTISGVVLDENGDALIGASVIVKGTQNGSATDVDGKFSLKVKPGATLVISYMGYETKFARRACGYRLRYGKETRPYRICCFSEVRRHYTYSDKQSAGSNTRTGGWS